MGPAKGYTVDDQFFADILSVGLAPSGIGYWAQIVTHRSGENPALDSATIMVDEGEEYPKQYNITMETIMNGVQRVMQDPPPNESTSNLVATYYQKWEWLRQSLEDGDTVMVDAEVADMVIQYGLLEKEIFG